MKINAGCGNNLLDGWHNVDKYGAPDHRWDLEEFPWPWDDSEVDEWLFHHSLEHMGFHPDTFIGIVKEIYRCSKPDAMLSIAVPHPNHRNFINDPTHVRAITPDLMALFSKKNNAEVRRLNGANSPLAEYHNVDFDIESIAYEMDPRWAHLGALSKEAQEHAILSHNNVLSEIKMVLRVRK